MARGNQRDKAREKNQKAAAGQVRLFFSLTSRAFSGAKQRAWLRDYIHVLCC